MSLEDQITRLTNVISMSQEGTAVAEIIRQRDAAQKEVIAIRSSRDYWMGQNRYATDRRVELERRVSSLRGVITRMKRKVEATHV